MLFQSYKEKQASLNEMGWHEDVGIMPQHQTVDWLKCIICQEQPFKKPKCPANSKRHDSGAGHVTFERDLTSFYEVGELHLAVNWECLNEGNGIASTLTSHFALWHKSCRDAFNRTKLESHGQSSSKQTRSSMFPESMKRRVCFFLWGIS